MGAPEPHVLPVLPTPLVSRSSHHAERVDEHTVRWAAATGLAATDEAVRRLRRARNGLLAAATCPELDHDTLRDTCDWYTWLTLFDDRFCDEASVGSEPALLGRYLVRFLAIIEHPEAEHPDDQPFAVALRDVCQRTVPRATRHQWQRFAQSFQGYFFALLWESAQRRADAPVPTSDYVFMRPYTAAQPTWLILIEIMHGIALSPEELADPALDELTTRFANVVTWQNDFISYRREVAADLRSYSLPSVLAEEHSVPPAQAARLAAAMYRSEMDRFRSALAALGAAPSPALRAFAGRVHDVVAGSQSWHEITGRYSADGHER